MKRIKIIFILFVLFSCSRNEEEILFFNIETSEIQMSWMSEARMIWVDSNIEWSVMSHSMAKWVTVEQVLNNGLRVSVSQNETGSSRTVDITLVTEIGNYHLNVIQLPSPQLKIIGDKVITVPYTESKVKVKVDSNVEIDYYFTDGGDTWLKKSIDISGFVLNDTLSFNVAANETGNIRKADIVLFNAEHSLYDTLTVVQNGKESGVGSWADGDWFLINGSLGDGPNLIIMGDGFTSKHLVKGGAYEKAVIDAYNYFFSIEPYKHYKNYFNVYGVVAESEREGVGEKNSMGLDNFSNKFSTAFGNGTEIVCDPEKVFEYARKVDGLGEEIVTVIVVLNSSKYAGTAYMFTDGNTIALCPMSKESSPNDFEGIIHHEAGGHAFGLLCDEYVYNESEIPQDRVDAIREWQKLKFYLNLDFTDDLSKILWKDFIGLEGYENIGAYQGGYEYRYGVWRCEENSCMNNNIPYFNVQSRWCIVRRIMQLAGVQYTINDFLREDNVQDPVSTRSSVMKVLPPLGTPVLNVR